jgi:hypothetical protein
MSLHVTKAGAYRAMRRYIVEKAEEQRNMELTMGLWKQGNPFIYEAWVVKPIKVLE